MGKQAGEKGKRDGEKIKANGHMPIKPKFLATSLP